MRLCECVRRDDGYCESVLFRENVCCRNGWVLCFSRGRKWNRNSFVFFDEKMSEKSDWCCCRWCCWSFVVWNDVWRVNFLCRHNVSRQTISGKITKQGNGTRVYNADDTLLKKIGTLHKRKRLKMCYSRMIW